MRRVGRHRGEGRAAWRPRADRRFTSSGVFTQLAYLQRNRFVGRFASAFLRLRGTYIPGSCLGESGLWLLHTGHGVVVDEHTRIGKDVWIFQNVTIGRAQPWTDRAGETGFVTVGRRSVLCAGAVVAVPPHGELRMAEGTVLAANAVLTCDTGPWEIWAGAPARKVGMREDAPGP